MIDLTFDKGIFKMSQKFDNFITLSNWWTYNTKKSKLPYFKQLTDNSKSNKVIFLLN